MNRVLVAAFLAALLCVPPGAVRADDASISLGTFESMIDGAPGLEAASKQIVADQHAVGVATAKTGLDYVYENALGPRSEIVYDNVNVNTVRYQQTAGLGLPLLGTATAQRDAVLAAQTDETDARIALAEDRRTHISNLREAYVLYWQYDEQQLLAARYVAAFQQKLGAARALRRNGFWTAANELDFLDALTRFETDVRNLRSSRRQQLAAIASALGTEVASFRPLEPVLGSACSPARDVSVRSANDIDATLARIAARTAQLKDEASRVRGSSIDAHASAGLTDVFDLVTPRAGYSLNAGVTAALPTHARSEERSLRAELDAAIASQDLLAKQRRAEITAATEAAIDELANARDDLRQSLRNEAAARESLREANVRFRTLSGAGAGAFVDVTTTLSELFAAENQTAIARGAVYLKANALLLLAPDACG